MRRAYMWRKKVPGRGPLLCHVHRQVTRVAEAAGARWDTERDQLDRCSSERRQESRPGFYPEGAGKPMKGYDWLVFRKNHLAAR